MNKLILTAAIAAATIVPAIVSPHAATAMPMEPATMVCQATKAGETSNAVMGTTKLTCHTVDMEKVMAAQKSMMSMMPKTMTDAQLKQMKADQAVFNSAFMLPAVPGGLGQPDR